MKNRGPSGYHFGTFHGLGVAVHLASVGDGSAMPCGAPFQWYWASAHPLASQNSDPVRWHGHEDARQHAARLLGEDPVPLREVQS